MASYGKKPAMSPARAIAGGIAIGTLIGTLMWAIEPVWMYRRALPYLGTPLVTVLLLYAGLGAGLGAVSGLVAALVSRRTGIGAHAVSFALTGWFFTSLLIGRNVSGEELAVFPVRETIGVAVALLAWAGIAVLLGRRGRRPVGAGVWILSGLSVVYLLVLAAWNPLFYYRIADKNGPADAPNVVLIVVDALRADHLGVYGYERETSPNLDRLAERGHVFEHAVSHGNRTIFAMPALFTSMYPSINGAVGYQTSMVPLADDRTTIAEMLASRGYASAGMMSNIYLKTAFGMTQGFDRTEQFNTTRFRFSVYRALTFLGILERPSYVGGGGPRANQVTDAALQWLGRFPKKDPFFLFVHYMDVHHAYRPPAEFEQMFHSSPEAAAIDGDELFEKTRDLVEGPPPLDFGGVELERLEDLYDACIRSTDDQIGRLIDAVDARSAQEGRKTVYVFTADHGDEFMEHGSLYHVNLAHMELLHVPLIITDPNDDDDAGPKRIGALARHIDVLPTIGDLAGAAIPDSAMGVSLAPVMEGKADEVVSVSFAEGDFCTAMVTPRWKILYVDTSDTYQLYDLDADPRGLVDVAARHPEVVAELRTAVDEYVRTAASRRQTQSREATSETVRQLRALGYVN